MASFAKPFPIQAFTCRSGGLGDGYIAGMGIGRVDDMSAAQSLFADPFLLRFQLLLIDCFSRVVPKPLPGCGFAFKQVRKGKKLSSRPGFTRCA